MSEEIILQDDPLDKALKNGFAFLVTPNRNGQMVTVTIYLAGVALGSFSDFLPDALETVNHAAELACESVSGRK
jgi:hypothetical protein